MTTLAIPATKILVAGHVTMKRYEGKMKEYRNEQGQLHRANGPAIEYANGGKEWYLNGKRHRTDGPAVEYADGYKAWYLNGQRHRTDGPAVEYADGSKEWYLNDQRH
ncbi:MAG: hypothetical protein KGH64_04285, partial [Candidatus Micrarchaeota archaeon]|nr:hypothetical protein [Candidatus Micrarchaeota archaeon]